MEKSEWLEDKLENPMKQRGLVNSRDAKLNHLYGNMVLDKTPEAKKALTRELNYRKHINHVFHAFASTLGMNTHAAAQALPKDFDCLRMMVETFKEHCGPFKDYEMKFGSYFVGACELIGEKNEIQTAMIDACRI